jgi:glycosyltransferase involved in cell wall biosynthesis
MNPRTIEIVICTHNRVQLLDRAILSLNRAHRPHAAKASILVVANACSDSTAALLNAYQQRATGEDLLPLRWVTEPTLGKCAALNRAISLLEGDVVAFVDDDHRVDVNYLVAVEHAVGAYPEATIWCGRVLPDWDGSEPKWVHDTGAYRIRPLPIPRQDQGSQPRRMPASEGRVPGGGNIILRREVFGRVGGYSLELGPVGHDLGGAEDAEFGQRALAAGEVIQYVPHIVQHHFVDVERLRLSYLIRKAYNRNLASAISGNRTASTPLHLWRKLAVSFLALLASPSPDRARFYLVRVAATIGQIRGHGRAIPRYRKTGAPELHLGE